MTGPDTPAARETRASRETPASEAARALLHTRGVAGRRPPRTTDGPRLFRAIVAYDGTDWSGWQRQRSTVSVAEMLLAALRFATRTDVSLHAAGRTDSGVHAEGQAVSIRAATALPPEALLHLCLRLLPVSIRVACVEEAPDGWNPQRDAIGKLYRYRLVESPLPAPALERVAWRQPESLDLARVRAGAAVLVGRHDFRAFRNDPGQERRGENTVRTIERIVVDRVHDVIRVDVHGPGFLYMMVRNVVAALVEVGSGRQEPEWIAALLASRDRRRGPAPAPPSGLTLVRVRYADGFGDVPIR